MADRESVSGTTLRSYTDLPIIDQYGNSWAISQSAQVMVDGVIDRATNGVTELAYINRSVWQWVQATRLWWSKTSPLAPWLPPEGTPNAPFGPIPDPRIDQILVAIASLTSADVAGIGQLTGAIEALGVQIASIPSQIPPDPRIAFLIGAVTRGFQGVHASVMDLSSRVDNVLSAIDQWGQAITSRFDDIDAADQATATALSAIAAQNERVIVMLLDLFPKTPKRITAHMERASSEGTQAAPPV